MIITVANKKGGCGKTTLAVNLASMLAAEGKTLLIDADHQASSMVYAALRPEDVPEFQAVQITNGTVHKAVKKFSKDYTNIVIDVGGGDTDAFRSAIYAADILLIPVLPSSFDLWSTEDTFKVFSELSTTKEELKALLVFNMLPGLKNQHILKESYTLVKEYQNKYIFKLAETEITYRVAYKESTEHGRSVCEMKGEKYIKAQKEMINLLREIRGLKDEI